MSQALSAASGTLETEVVIVGAGPCGLFQVFELGLLGMSAHVVDSLAHPGGQCTELYPDKPIYDIPALPVCGAQELVDRLMQQIKPFNPQFHLGQEVTELRGGKTGASTCARPRVPLSIRARSSSRAVSGSFQPRRIGLEGAEAFEGSAIRYRVRDAHLLHGKRLVVFGGGDSALDWAIELAPKAAEPHARAPAAGFSRRAGIGDPRCASWWQPAACDTSKASPHSLLVDDGALRGVTVKAPDGTLVPLDGDHLLVFFGLHPKLGPIAEWGMELEKKALKVDTEKFQTSVPGIFAVGDINTYPGKKKLILSGFHEAALAAFAIQHHLYPQKKQFLQYTTTSPVMQKRLGVADILTSTEEESNDETHATHTAGRRAHRRERVRVHGTGARGRQGLQARDRAATISCSSTRRS